MIVIFHYFTFTTPLNSSLVNVVLYIFIPFETSGSVINLVCSFPKESYIANFTSELIAK